MTYLNVNKLALCHQESCPYGVYFLSAYNSWIVQLHHFLVTKLVYNRSNVLEQSIVKAYPL